MGSARGSIGSWRPRAGVLAALVCRRRWMSAAVIGAVVALATAACAPTSSETGSGPTPSGSANAVPNNCDDYLKLSSAQRDEAFRGKTVRSYTSAGLSEAPVTKEYDAQCPSHSGSHYYLGNIDSNASEPQCDVFIKLTPAQQQTWISGLQQEQYWGLSPAMTTPEYLAKACRDFGVKNMVRLGNTIKGLTSYVSWGTETRLGFTWRSAMAVGAPKTGPDVRVLGGGSTIDNKPIPTYSPGSSCGLDPKVDAIVPLTLFMANTTAGRTTIPTSAQWTLTVASGASPVTTAYLESNFSSGTKCSSVADSYGSATMNVTYKETSDFSDSNSYSVVLKNWISPRYPNGATQDLSGYVITAQSDSPSSDDPVVKPGTAKIRLDGSVSQ